MLRRWQFDKFEKDRDRNKFKDRPGDCRLLDRSDSARGRLWAAAMTGVSGSSMFNGNALCLDPDLLALARRSEYRPLHLKWAERAKAARLESMRIFEKVDTSFSRLISDSNHWYHPHARVRVSTSTCLKTCWL